MSKRYSYTEKDVNAHVPETGGVYALIYEDAQFIVFYVGQSGNLRKRLLEHLSPRVSSFCIKMYLEKYSCYFKFIEISSQAERDTVEKKAIRKWEPHCNE